MGNNGCHYYSILTPQLADEKEKEKEKTGMEGSGPTPSTLHWASWPCGSGTGGAPTAAAERNADGLVLEHMYVLGKRLFL